MTKRILIDANQSEETRIVYLNENKIEEFDYENKDFKQIKSNVYLAKITRVEPSLQAAFVEYGGNKQGFLAFSEIHPDYYRIPVEDREELENLNILSKKNIIDENNDIISQNETQINSDEPEILGGEDFVSNNKSISNYISRYKIQEVINRKQILLVQVVKEERGNKGAAMTTFLSLPGRYCVLMPNSNRGGGISRKITNYADRKRLKAIINDFDLPENSAIIVRTAGSKRTKTEIKRDYTYLSNLWNEIRNKTLKSEAPALIHEEGSLIRRTIRDIYTNDIDNIIVEGDNGYKIAKEQMKMLVPSHAKKVSKFTEDTHLFQKFKIEEQLEMMHQDRVNLNSGGYLIINQTEALVAIDVNSGKSTRQRNIEETAFKTNIEAANEIGRQLKLRDLSGLIVIDFIDMEENKNNISVERKLKDSLRNDRARIQVGNISHFGLLEMSRQRLRPSLVESISHVCNHCNGTGKVRNINSLSLYYLRIIEEEINNNNINEIHMQLNPSICNYILNKKRENVHEIEKKYGITISIYGDEKLGYNENKFINMKNNLPEFKNEQNDNFNNSDETTEINKRKKRNKKQFRKKKKNILDGNKNNVSDDINSENTKIKKESSEDTKFNSEDKKSKTKIKKKNDLKKDKVLNSEIKNKTNSKLSKNSKSIVKKKKNVLEKNTKDKNILEKETKRKTKTNKNSISKKVDVVDVSKIAPERKKRGWWSK